MLKYRIATIEDLPKIVEIYNSVIPSRIVTADLEPVSVESRTEWFRKHTPKKWPLFVVENQEKQIIGWLSFSPYKEHAAYDITTEIGIYIDENFRRKGVGKEILNFAIESALNFGFENLVGVIFGHNIPSLKLFENFGFEVWGRLPNATVLDGIYRDVVIVGKRV